MSICPFFKNKELLIPNPQYSSSKQSLPSTYIRLPWCAHMHSPVKESDLNAIGAASLLRCEGHLSACQIAPAASAK